MNIASQALHLLRFELLRLRWWIAAYAVALSASTFNAVSHAWLTDISPYLVVFTGMIATLVVVQGDSPYRHDAFWRGRAVHPRALLLAKSAAIGMLFVVTPLVVAIVVADAFDLSTGGAIRFVAPSVSSLSMWVAVAFLFGTCTQDVKSAVLLCLVTAFGFMLLMTALSAVSPKIEIRPFEVITPAIALAAIAAAISVAYLRPLSRRYAIAVTMVLASVGVTSFSNETHEATAIPTATVNSEILEITDMVLQGDRSYGGAPYLRVRIRRERPGIRYALHSALMTAHFSNGDSVSVAMNGTLENGDLQELVTLPAGVTWRSSAAITGAPEGALVVPMLGSNSTVALNRIGPNTTPPDSSIMTLSDVRSAGERLLREAVTRVEVHATAARYVLEEVASLPYANNADISKDGRRILVRDTTRTRRRGLVVEVSALGAIPLSERQWITDIGPQNYVVVLQNAARGEATLSTQQQRRKLDGAFIIPGIAQSFEAIHIAGADATDPVLDPTWLSGATIRVLRWKRDGAVQLDAEQTVR